MIEKVISNYGFDHDGKNYVIKIFQIGRKFYVIPYYNNSLASYYTYSVEVENMDNWKNLYGDKFPYVRLKEIVELDIKQGFGIKKSK